MRRIVSRKDEYVNRVAKICFPEFSGKEVTISDNPPKELNSFWDEGNKNEYVFFDQVSEKTFSVHSNHPYFEPNQPRNLEHLPLNILLVEHSIYGRGNNQLTIYAQEAQFTRLLPAIAGSVVDQLSDAEKKVIAVTRSLIAKVRREYAGLSPSDYDSAVESLIEKKLMTKSKGLTTDGKNIADENRNWERMVGR